MYKGEKKPEELLRAGGDGVGARDLRLRRRQLAPRERPPRPRPGPSSSESPTGDQWAAFGFIASEAELARKGGLGGQSPPSSKKETTTP